MKKIIFPLALVLISFTTWAQNASGEKVVSLNFGYSLTGGLINALDNDEGSDFTVDDSLGLNGVNVNTLPAISVAFDYGIGEVFSLGVMYSLQSFSGSVDQYSWVNSDGVRRSESLDISLIRNSVAILPRFHYKLGNENIDLYSGLRVGFLFWTNNIESTDPNFNEFGDFTGGRPSVAIVPLGGRFYFTDEFGANFEIALGAPYIASVGAQYRF